VGHPLAYKIADHCHSSGDADAGTQPCDPMSADGHPSGSGAPICWSRQSQEKETAECWMLRLRHVRARHGRARAQLLRAFVPAIRINSITPGLIYTDMQPHSMP
jgi:hypothetical protein